MAHDLAVNQLIEDSRGQRQPVSWPQGFRPLLHEAFRGMAAEDIYDLLWDVLSLDRPGDPWPGHPGPVSQAAQRDIRDRWGETRVAAAEEILPQLINLDLREGSRMSQDMRDRLRRKWQEGLLSAAERSMGEKGIGTLPGWAQRLIGPLLHPKVPWQEVLAQKVHGHLAGTQRSYVRPGRRSHALGSMLPGRLRNRGVVGVFIDVSGSISSVELEAFLAELRGILATTNCLIRFMTWDVSVGEDLVLEDEEELSLTRSR
jgi:hypothetical protein